MKSTLILIFMILGSILLWKSAYIVYETEQVIITQFGKPVGNPITSPGLKIKKPFLETANYFDKRFIAWDGEPKQVSTRDKRFININTYARWRISDPLQYAKRLFDESKALTRLGSVLEGATQNAIANHDLIELVRSSNRDYVSAQENSDEKSNKEKAIIKSGRDEITKEILELAKESTNDLGIEILDFQFKRINYVPEVRKKVYERMISERKRIAEEFRSQGAGESARISGQKDRDLKEITSDAYRRSQEIKGKADAEAANIYAAAYNKDADFYRFMRTMEIYKETLDKETVLVLSTDGEFLKYLGSASKMKNKKIDIRSTTILGVRLKGKVAVAGDGQVTLGDMAMKQKAVKVRKFDSSKGGVVGGFAGAAADALTLFEKFEQKLDEYEGDLKRSVVEMAKDWRMDKMLRHLEALLLVMDKKNSFIIAGDGNVIEPDGPVLSIGSGGGFAQAAALAFHQSGKYSAKQVAEKSLKIAADLCIYTNDSITVLEI